MPKRGQGSQAARRWAKWQKVDHSLRDRRKDVVHDRHPSVRKKLKQWDNESMIRAIESVKGGVMGINQAARNFKVPQTTLRDRLSGRVEHGAKVRATSLPHQGRGRTC